jgi:hypothetical protein
MEQSLRRAIHRPSRQCKFWKKQASRKSRLGGQSGKRSCVVVDCGGWILDSVELAIIIRRAKDLDEFWELFAEAREMEEGHGRN